MEKLEPGTKVKIIGNHTGHGITIGTICHIDYKGVGELGYIYQVYDLDYEWIVCSKDIEVVQDRFKVGDVIKFRTGNTRYVITSMSDDAISYKHLKHGGQYSSYKTADIEVLEKTYEDYVSIKDKCLFILDTPEWKEWIKNNIEPTFKVGDIVTMKDNNGSNLFKIESILSGDIATIKHIDTGKICNEYISRFKLYTGTDTVELSSIFNFGDKVKVIDAGRMCSTYDEAAEAMGLTKYIRSNGVYTSEQKESITNNNYYKIIGFHYDKSKNEYVGIENLIDGKQYIINSEGLEHINLSGTLTGVDTGCIDYPISYVDTSQVSEYITCAGPIKRNTLLTNNNTMEKLNQLRADKFFANEKNLVAIESLDTLLKDAIDLVNATGSELGKVSTKLIGLNRKLESAVNNQDVAMLKDLIASTKVVQEFVDELKGKTISKFETAKTKFDVAGYLKD